MAHIIKRPKQKARHSPSPCHSNAAMIAVFVSAIIHVTRI
jgi:hypothetical protein